MEDEMYNQGEMLIKDVSYPLFSNKGWIKFLGVFMVIYGGLFALSLVGILFAWLPIWQGVLLIKAAGNIERAHFSGDKDALFQTNKNLATYFTISAVLVLIGVIFTVLVLVVFFTTGLFTTYMEQMQQMDSSYY